ncbi:DsbA family protein [Candidatus Woesearchaeota archaeon]|nr:DsbA family protein [Candidatus Woesearchaeota archaeon]
MVKIEEQEDNKQHHEIKSAAQEKEETVTISKVTLWKGVSGALGIFLIISILTGGFGFGESSPTAAAVGVQIPSREGPSAPSFPDGKITDMNSLADDDPFLGKEDAPITIIEFSDYECPFCARFYQQTLSSIKEEYIKTGKVKFVYRDFPLSFHQQAEPAAIAANCAGDQGKYFEFHDKIFSNGGAGGKNEVDYKKWARELSLDLAAWETCIKDPKQRQELQKDIADGSAAGISGTPGFVINGKLISGAQPFSVFQQVIEAELS